LNRVATVLDELSNELNFNQLPGLFFDRIPAPVIQRLGYLLDVALGYNDKGDELLEKMKEFGCATRNTPLKNRKSTAGCITNKKWSVIVNEQIEIDE
jgi:hypothetical protein